MIRRAFLALSMIVPAGAVLAQSGSDLFGQKQIVQAVVEGDEEKVRQALLKQESPNQTANNGQPLLSWRSAPATSRWSRPSSRAVPFPMRRIATATRR